MSDRSHACPHCGREYARSDDQNRKFHAMCNDIRKVRQWAGEYRDVETWKRLFIAAWMRSTDRRVELLPAIDGHGFDALYRRSSRLGKSEMSELIEYVNAWCSDNEVALAE